MTTEALEPQNQPHKGDKWTNFNTGFQMISGTAGGFYLVGDTVDLFGNFHRMALGLSLPAMIIGLTGAIFIALCEAYNHQQLNTYHQKENIEDMKAAQSPATQQPLLPAKEEDTSELSKLQGVALFGCFIAHTVEFAAPLIFIFNLTFADQLPHYTQVLIVLLVLACAALASIADVRTAKTAIEELNAQSLSVTNPPVAV
ncbi:MAG: hypothetical protein QM752_06385 [Gammaproteobacteria bacterium]